MPCFRITSEHAMKDSFKTRGTLTVGGKNYSIARLSVLAQRFPGIAKLPFSHRILLENLLRTEDGVAVSAADIEALAKWDAKADVRARDRERWEAHQARKAAGTEN